MAEATRLSVDGPIGYNEDFRVCSQWDKEATGEVWAEVWDGLTYV